VEIFENRDKIQGFDNNVTDCCGGHLTAAYYSFIDPVRIKG